jgi:large subunit ribosomal protein L15
MGTTLHTLSPNHGANRDRKRLGRGHGSGLHKTSGKGQKGQKARTGHHGTPKPGFEGGQTILARRLPKRGFNNARFRREVFAVNLGDLAERFGANATIDPGAMKEKGLVPRTAEYVKVLAGGNGVANGLTVRAHFFSESAKEKLAAAKGKAEAIALPPPYAGKAAKKNEKSPKGSSKSQEKPA